jgi:hypothetical protein
MEDNGCMSAAVVAANGHKESIESPRNVVKERSLNGGVSRLRRYFAQVSTGAESSSVPNG